MKTTLLIFLFAIAACNNMQSTAGAAKDSDVVATGDTIKEPVIKTDFANDSIINIRFKKDSSSIKVTGKISGINKPVTVFVPVKQGKQLSVKIAPEDSVANIRINQIFTPSGKADGPFGRELTRKITEEGTYKLIIAEDLMQGDEWKGRFWLTVKVE